MRLGDLDSSELHRRLQTQGLRIRCGPFVFNVRSPIDSVAEGLMLLYADHPLQCEEDFADFQIELLPGSGVRRWLKPQCRFLFDGRLVFEPMPLSHAYPLLEWAMNWCVSTQAHHYMILHAAVVEREGLAAILPAPPGSGKSTLCAGLAHRGWRLLSDELALIKPGQLQISPLCRPISLKNESIDVIGRFVANACMNRISEETAKGRVTHLKIPVEHVKRMDETAQPRWVIFPRFQTHSPAVLREHSRSEAMLELASNSFNYAALGSTGFRTLADVVQACECFDFQYGQLDEAVRVFDRLVTAIR